MGLDDRKTLNRVAVRRASDACYNIPSLRVDWRLLVTSGNNYRSKSCLRRGLKRDGFTRISQVGRLEELWTNSPREPDAATFAMLREWLTKLKTRSAPADARSRPAEIA
jgi:hypothetical protein